MFLLYELLPFSVINNLGIPSSKLQTNLGVLQIDTENSATGNKVTRSSDKRSQNVCLKNAYNVPGKLHIVCLTCTYLLLPDEELCYILYK